MFENCPVKKMLFWASTATESPRSSRFAVPLKDQIGVPFGSYLEINKSKEGPPVFGSVVLVNVFAPMVAVPWKSPVRITLFRLSTVSL
ncbi:hypothetical protein D3C80_1604440 [compost metagenome]